ncbi:hypothetical protein C8J57DRAFT_1256006 [Mycena rebaudengoi]|nr:hypothetical protein C8J57DRAFT_1256006 [Mycena rebaudengoi]
MCIFPHGISLFLFALKGPPNRPGTSSMPPKEGALWEFFFKGPKQNVSINEAYCLGCIRPHQCVKDPPNDTDLVLKDTLKWEEATFTAAHEESGHVRGEKSAMIAHLIGRKPCPYASSVAKRKAAQIKAMTHQTLHQPQKNKRGCFTMSDGWKDDSKNPITGVNISANGKSYLINLIQSNRQKKDGASMCLAFESMIDKAEQDYLQ